MSAQYLLPKCVAALAGGLVVAGLLSGCASTGSKGKQLGRELERLMDAYMDGDVNEARRSLEQEVDLLQSPKAEVYTRGWRAHVLFVTYARLYLLERRVGRDDKAEAALIRARFWALENYDLTEEGEFRKPPLREYMSDTSRERLDEDFDRWDKLITYGRGPKYAQVLGR